MQPEELLYAASHEWVSIESNDDTSIATVGISAFALEALTDLVFMELPGVGDQVEAGQTMGEIESVKAVSDLYSPVTGEVVEVNQDAVDNLETLGDDPYEKGWLIKVKLSDEAALAGLMDFATYQKKCEEEEH